MSTPATNTPRGNEHDWLSKERAAEMMRVRIDEYLQALTDRNTAAGVYNVAALAGGGASREFIAANNARSDFNLTSQWFGTRQAIDILMVLCDYPERE